MTRSPIWLGVLIATLCFVCMTPAVHAEHAAVPAPAHDHFIIHLPPVDRTALIERLESLRSQLVQRRQALVQVIEDRKPGIGDAVITAIIPGGLLYAGYRATRYQQVKNKLARISADIEEYTSDILAMQSGSAPVFIARLGIEQ
jgi:hypothetical protein